LTRSTQLEFRIDLLATDICGRIASIENRCPFTAKNANRVYGTRLLIDDAAHDMAGDAIEAREIDCITVVGRTQPVRIYELRAMAGELPPEHRNLFDLYSDALALYRLVQCDTASEVFKAVLACHLRDGPSHAEAGRAVWIILWLTMS
jgi:hypothetical protein